MAPAEAVVGVIGIVEERVLAAAPVEAAGIDDNATKAGAVSTKPLGEGVDDDVGTVIEGIGEVWSRAGRIDDEGNAVFLGDGSDGIKVGNFEGGIGNGFTKEGASLVVNGVGELAGILRVDKADLDPKRGKDVVELGVAAAIKIAGGDNVVASLGEVDDGIKNRGGAGGVSEAGEFVGPFKQANALFQDIGGGIHQPGVNVPQLFEGKEVGGVFGVLESECGALIDGNGAGVGVGIRLVTTVEAKCFVFHVRQELAWILEMGNTGVRSCAGAFGELLKMPF